MRGLLEELDAKNDSSLLERLHNLVEDTQNLQQSLAALNPSKYLLFQVANLDGEEVERPSWEHWAHVMVLIHKTRDNGKFPAAEANM